VAKRRNQKLSKRKFRIKKGDTVYVTVGKDKGRTGKVLRVLTDRDKAIVEKINMVKRHTKPTQQNPAGGIVEKEAPMHISNLMMYDAKNARPTRVGIKTLASRERIRFSKASGEEI